MDTRATLGYAGKVTYAATVGHMGDRMNNSALLNSGSNGMRTSRYGSFST